MNRGVFEGADNPKNRNVEYDAFDDRYGNFLLDEIIPKVTQRYSITEDPDRWGICGGSSGGNCAFTAAWLRPDRFRRVIGCLSSFVQMPGGNPYTDLIPGVWRKPLRFFLQAGHRDLRWNKPECNWLASNLRVAAVHEEPAIALLAHSTTPNPPIPLNDENIIVLGDLEESNADAEAAQRHLASFALAEIDRIIADLAKEVLLWPPPTWVRLWLALFRFGAGTYFWLEPFDGFFAQAFA